MKTSVKNLNITFPVEDSFGFAGTIQSNSHNETTGHNLIDRDAAQRLWNLACAAVADVFSETNLQVIENFLRSVYGRHLADEVFTEAGKQINECSLEAGITASLRRTRRIRRRLGGMVEKLAWQKPFDSVRKETLSGNWLD